MENASNNKFLELVLTTNTTLQFHPRFANIVKFRTLHHSMEDGLLKLAIRVEQMFDDLSQLTNEIVREATLEKLMKMLIEHYAIMNQMMNVAIQSMHNQLGQLIIDVNEYKIQRLNRPITES